MRAAALRLLSLLTIAAALFAIVAPARAHYFCRMMQRPMTERCCGAEHAEQQLTAEKALRTADCCEKITAATRSAVLVAREPGVKPCFLAFAQPVRIVQDGPALARDALGAVQMPKGMPLAIGPPLFIAHRSLLI